MTETFISTRNPATGAWIADHPAIGRAQVDTALTTAVRAQRAWRTSEVSGRAARLRALAALLRDEVADHARLISTEMGKPITEARAEVLKCALTCDYYADHLAEFLAPTPVPTEALRSFVSYEPIGVVLGVMPWNFPYWQVIRFLAPTLGAGNGGLLKHASNVTGCALALQDLFDRAGFPLGLVQTLVLAEHGWSATSSPTPGWRR